MSTASPNRSIMHRVFRDVGIEGDGFYLAQFELDLVTERYLSWLRDETVNEFLVGAHSGISFEEAARYCEKLTQSSEDLFLAIFSKTSQKYIGNVRLGPFDSVTGWCRYSMMIGPIDSRGRGLGTNVVAASIAFCFDSLKCRKFLLEVPEAHRAARRVYEKNGLEVGRRLHPAVRADGTKLQLIEMYLDQGRYRDLRCRGM